MKFTAGVTIIVILSVFDICYGAAGIDRKAAVQGNDDLLRHRYFAVVQRMGAEGKEIHHHVLYSVAAAMEEAESKLQDQSPSVQKCIAAQDEIEIAATLIGEENKETRESAKNLLVEFNRMYNVAKNRNPDDYYYLMRKSLTGPMFTAVQSLEAGEFGVCFEIIVEMLTPSPGA